MTLNESELEVLIEDNLEEAEKRQCCSMQSIDSGYNNLKLYLQTSLILWNLLANSRLAKIKQCFSHFDKIIATE
ncbi:40846_t:CDS:2 [Gigaspora margarita]|uniref:40846_t:CDS:1 n=1 Tax=Gigaspora margarita TaxID=4874 RepID=A0ABN7WMF1_GIGMA|nr:40846_t:CDS:2 [Gigaspora margarita]